MIASLRSIAIIIGLLITNTYAADGDGELSAPTVIQYKNISEGDLKFTYWTFIRGPKGL